jgi:predicted enzyme related to lactoylglutathione lyase
MAGAKRQLVHLELHTGDAAGARAFYSQLCGWRPMRVHTGAGAYETVDMGNGIGGGIVECPAERPLWLPYIGVPEIVTATERARIAGAEVLLEPREGPAGWRAVVSTPEAGEIAFWQQKR